MNNDVTVTITGATSASGNNGTYTLPQTAFFPRFAGLFAVNGSFLSVSLSTGGQLQLDMETIPTAHGSGVQAGDTVNVLDFAPATSHNFPFQAGIVAATTYNQTTSITATQVSSAPEPASLTLLATGVIGLLGYAWRRRRAAA
jgi:MYXO-CTERM domain-containing protein